MNQPLPTPSQSGDDILFEKQGRCGFITLNREKALNAVTADMYAGLRAQLLEWQKDPDIYGVIIQSGSDKAFCAGGDIRELHEKGSRDPELAVASIRAEYPIYWQIDRYAKCSMPLVNGLIMGGGAGLCVYCSHSVGAENLRFAMPETGIGFFPDVGASYFMNRFPGYAGTYLALTGRTVGPADAFYLGVISHFVPSEHFDTLRDAFREADPIDPIIDGLHENPGDSDLKKMRSTIDAVFSASRVEEIVSRLESLPAQHADWAESVRDELGNKSPTSLKITLRLMREGRNRGLRSGLAREFRAGAWCFTQPDFYEGVRAVLLDKDFKPEWQPASLEEVTSDRVEACFAPIDEELEMPDYGFQQEQN